MTWLPVDLGHDQPDPWDDQPDWIGDGDDDRREDSAAWRPGPGGCDCDSPQCIEQRAVPDGV
jgi:hypothetical protein